jgi:hypothetical protein
MSELPVFIAGLIVGLVVGLVLGRLRQTQVIGPRLITNTLSIRRASPAPPERAAPLSTASHPYVGRAALLRRLATDLAGKRDRSASSAPHQDP